MSDAKDRNGCHPDCGKTQREHALSEHDSMEPGWAMNIASERIYCTAACRDARPIAAPEAAKPQHPERRAGQRWRWTSGTALSGEFTILGRKWGMWDVLPSRQDDTHLWEDSCWETGSVWSLILIADAPAPEATVKAEDHVCGNGCVVCAYHSDQRRQRLYGAPLPAGKVEAAKAVCTGFKGCANAPVSRMVTALAPKRAVRVDWCDTCYRLHERPSAFGGVYAGDISELPERLSRPRLSYQPMDDSFAEDC